MHASISKHFAAMTPDEPDDVLLRRRDFHFKQSRQATKTILASNLPLYSAIELPL